MSHQNQLSPKLTAVPQIEGEQEKDSEAMVTYKDLHAKRPICQKLEDHNQQIIDTSNAQAEDTEYQSTINKLEVANTYFSFNTTIVMIYVAKFTT